MLYPHGTPSLIGVPVPDTIALVTLVRSSRRDATPSRELIEQIREALKSSGISENWAIEKITILEGAGFETSSEKILNSPGKKKRL
jgi:hypothetical protein